MSALTHQHKQTSIKRAILRRSGIPFEVERKVCSECKRVLDEKPLRRAAA